MSSGLSIAGGDCSFLSLGASRSASEIFRLLICRPVGSFGLVCDGRVFLGGLKLCFLPDAWKRSFTSSSASLKPVFSRTWVAITSVLKISAGQVLSVTIWFSEQLAHIGSLLHELAL